MYAVEWTLLGSVQAPGLRVPVSLVMARQPKPKALSSLQSDQRSYTSERVSELLSRVVVSRELWLVSGELLED
jgi:hypothetical protein